MKKVILLMSILAISLSFTACNNKTSEKTSLESSVSTEAGSITKETIKEEISDNKETRKKDEYKLDNFNNSASIEETVLVDENYIKITATELDYDNYCVTLKLNIENNSNENLSFVTGSVGYSCNSINGYMIDDGYLNCDIAAGKKANDTIKFDYNALSLYGINEIADIEVGFSITDENYNKFITGPRQIKTSIYDSFDYSVDYYKTSIMSDNLKNKFDYAIDYFSEDKIYDQNGIAIISEGLMTNTDGEKIVFLEAENNSNETVTITTNNISLNGLVVTNGTWSNSDINPGKRCIIDLSLSSMMDSSYYETFGISDIGNVTLSVILKDDEYNDITNPQTINMNFPGVDSSFDASGKEVYNENGIRIVSKGFLEDDFEYSDDLNMVFLVENKSKQNISISDVYDSVSINGYMINYICSSSYLSPGESAIVDFSIFESTLEENNISKIEDIKTVELSFEIRNDNYKTIAEPIINIEY